MTKKIEETVENQTAPVAEQTEEVKETKTEETAENTDSVEENAEEITTEEALESAIEEINRLREENTAVIAKATEEAETAEKQISELLEKLAAAEEKIAELEEKVKDSAEVKGSVAFYVELLNKLQAKFDQYSGIRRERLRREFITDITEEIQRQKGLINNA